MTTDTNHTDLLREVREIVREEVALIGERPHLPPEGRRYLTVEDVTRQLRIGKTTLWALREKARSEDSPSGGVCYSAPKT